MNILSNSLIRSRLEDVTNKISDVCNSSNRNIEEVKLVIVTKGHSTSQIEAVINGGAKIIGENYPEETSDKISILGPTASKIQWHMIGHLQSRKTKLMLENFNYFHALDSVKLALRLDRQIEDESRKLPVLLQFNVGGEESKYGWDASDEKKWPQLLSEVNEIVQMKKLEVNGLMTMAPLTTSKYKNRYYFDRLRRLSDFFNKEFPDANFKELSMGTSHDFEEAIQEGATFIRIGTAIMGERDYSR